LRSLLAALAACAGFAGVAKAESMSTTLSMDRGACMSSPEMRKIMVAEGQRPIAYAREVEGRGDWNGIRPFDKPHPQVITHNPVTREGYVIRGMDAPTIEGSARFCVLARVRDVHIVDYTLADTGAPAAYAERLKPTLSAMVAKGQRVALIGVSTDLDDKTKAPQDIGYAVFAISAGTNSGVGLAVAFDRSRRVESELTEFAFAK
jgi:hypothetical protein